MTQPNYKKKKKRLLLKLFRRLILIAIGAILVAVGLEIFLVPNAVIDGGITGISIMLSHLTGIKLGLLLFLLNLPFFYVGYRHIGRAFALFTLWGVAIMSVGTYLLQPVNSLTQDPLLASVFGGIIIGIGIGLVIRNGGSLDGTEMLAILANKKLPLSVGQTVMLINLFILGSAGFLFGWDRAMYSLIAYFIAFKLIDTIIEGFNETKAVWMISDEAKELGQAILHELGRGVTYLYGEGAYTAERKRIIFCIITRLEEAKLREIVEDIDPNAFLAIGSIHDVQGERFQKNPVH